MRGWRAFGIAAAWAATAQARPPTIILPPRPPEPPSRDVAAPPVAVGGQRPMAFTRLVGGLQTGATFGEARSFGACVNPRPLTWTGGRREMLAPEYVDAFRDEMTKAGLKVEGDPGNLFERQTSVSDYEVGAVITAMDIRACFPRIGLRDTDTVEGSISMDIEWQVYSTLQHALVAKIHTQGGFDKPVAGPGGLSLMMIEAFRGNAQALTTAPAFRGAFAGPAAAPGERIKPPARTPIVVTGAKTAAAGGARPVGEAARSVVLIQSGDSQGSGFLVGADGILLTVRRLVGEAKFVRVRWSDGAQALGEVVRTDKIRDVALIRTDPHGRQTLPLRRAPPRPGDTVYAIGAPLDAKFQGTVTHGVVSATRIFQGLAFIQSDARVAPGDSGAPLLDEQGAVVGLAQSSASANGAPTGINLFIPIRDALDFLGAEVR